MSRKVWSAGDQLNAADLNGNFFFGGTGADGALSTSSGTTTISFGSARELVKNYTSVSVTGTAALAFSTNHTSGSTFRLRSTGSVTLTSSATRVIDLRLMGGAVGSGPGAAGAGGYISGNSAAGGAGGTGGSADVMGTKGAEGSNVATGNVGSYSYAGQPAPAVAHISVALLRVTPGSGGTSGVGNGGSAGSGGRGGGALVIECAGTYTFTTSIIDTSGETASNASGSAGTNQGGSGGGGGGSAGQILVVCGTLGTDSGTYTQTGGSGGTGSAAGSSSGLTPQAGQSGGAGAAALNIRSANVTFS